MTGLTPFLFGGALLSLSALLLFLLVLLIVVIIGRVLLALAWRIVLIALAVVFVLWLLGSFGLSLV